MNKKWNLNFKIPQVGVGQIKKFLHGGNPMILIFLLTANKERSREQLLKKKTKRKEFDHVWS